jgi:hypothetical protein
MATSMTFNERFLDNETQITANRTDIDDLLSRIEWEQEDSAWQMRESTSPDLYDTAYIDAMEETLSDAIGEKLDKNLGTAIFNDAATTEIYALSLHDALPI